MTETTGSDVLRARLRSYNKAPNALARLDIPGVGIGHLESFLAGKDLSADAKCALAKLLFSNASFDAERNLMVANAQPSRPTCSIEAPRATGDPFYNTPRQVRINSTPASRSRRRSRRGPDGSVAIFKGDTNGRDHGDRN